LPGAELQAVLADGWVGRPRRVAHYWPARARCHTPFVRRSV
jgi:hypothetical protein